MAVDQAQARTPPRQPDHFTQHPSIPFCSAWPTRRPHQARSLLSSPQAPPLRAFATTVCSRTHLPTLRPICSLIQLLQPRSPPPACSPSSKRAAGPAAAVQEQEQQQQQEQEQELLASYCRSTWRRRRRRRQPPRGARRSWSCGPRCACSAWAASPCFSRCGRARWREPRSPATSRPAPWRWRSTQRCGGGHCGAVCSATGCWPAMCQTLQTLLPAIHDPVLPRAGPLPPHIPHHPCPRPNLSTPSPGG